MKDAPEKQSALDAIVAEAKTDLVPREIDWSRLERKLEARIAEEERAPRLAHLRASGAGGRLLALGLAAAAAAVLVVSRDREVAPLGTSPVATGDAIGTAGTLRASESGEVRVGGIAVETGLGLRGGDVVEVATARAIFERPRKVTWMLEGETGPGRGRARVASAGEPVVLALEEGAIEAQVAKSDAPESFAVDVSSGGRTVRVAVHGTHLRVAKVGSRLVLDLTEGVVALGVPPKTGPTYGTLVTAPAHVELDVADPAAVPRVEHLASSVRPPVALGTEPVAVAAVPNTTPSPDRAPRPTPAALPPAGSTGVVERPQPSSPQKPETHPTMQTPAAFAAAVRDCVTATRRARSEVRVTVASTLRLRLSEVGDVQAAVFDPPLPPEVQACAASKIYGPKLDVAVTGTSVEIPIQLSY